TASAWSNWTGSAWPPTPAAWPRTSRRTWSGSTARRTPRPVPARPWPRGGPRTPPRARGNRPGPPAGRAPGRRRGRPAGPARPAVGTGVAATAVTVRGDRLESVSTSAGEVSPGAVVFATGQPPVIDGLELDIPSDRVKGHLIVTEPALVGLPCTVAPVATPLE